MNVIFLTLAKIDIQKSGIYSDLMRLFVEKGHNVYVVFPTERRQGIPTTYTNNGNIHYLAVKTLNIQKTNIIEKGLGTILLETQFRNAIKKYLYGVSFDLILYSTPPITFSKVIAYLKGNNKQAISYLLLKDIFPQNAVDLRMFRQQSLMYWYFRKKEKHLYQLSDYIGCMSPANVEYLLKYNSYLKTNRVEIAPNSVEVTTPITIDRHQLRSKYNLPQDKPIFVYGGNLGKPQGIPFLIECLNANKNRQDCHFLVVGSGTEYHKLQNWMSDNHPQNITLLNYIPKDEYDQLLRSCDVGLIFLDYRFTIPNYPSRLLPYLQYKMPIVAATDHSSDVGKIAQENGYGLCCYSNDVDAFTKLIDKMLQSDRKTMGEAGYEYLLKHYTTEHTYQSIIKHF